MHRGGRLPRFLERSACDCGAGSPSRGTSCPVIVLPVKAERLCSLSPEIGAGRLGLRGERVSPGWRGAGSPCTDPSFLRSLEVVGRAGAGRRGAAGSGGRRPVLWLRACGGAKPTESSEDSKQTAQRVRVGERVSKAFLPGGLSPITGRITLQNCDLVQWGKSVAFLENSVCTIKLTLEK